MTELWQDRREAEGKLPDWKPRLDAAAGLASPLGVVADWNGQDLNLSASVVPLRCVPVVISPGLADVTGSAGSPRRFIIGAAVGFRPADLSRTIRSCF